MTGSSKIVLITGGTGGIGLEIAVGLAKLGWTIVVVGRDEERGRAALTDIMNRSGGRSVELLLADLSSQRDIQKLVEEFTARHDRLDVLINNVGGLYGKPRKTVDGIECTLALNHLCPFLLTHLLLPLLRKSAPSRIINVSSEGHRLVDTVDFDDFELSRWKRGFPLYGQTKLANLLFTYELARRLNGTKITVNAVHPGIVDTPLFRTFLSERFDFIGGFVARAAVALARQISYRTQKFNSVEEGTACPIYLASSDEVSDISGKYFGLDKKIMETSPASRDAALSARVWETSAALCRLEVTA